MAIHLLELLRIFEAAIRATIWCILTFEVEVPTTQTRVFAIALDLAPFAFVTKTQVLVSPAWIDDVWRWQFSRGAQRPLIRGIQCLILCSNCV
jgi:hypothetical protein